MSYHFLDDKDPRIDVMFQGLSHQCMAVVHHRMRSPAAGDSADRDHQKAQSEKGTGDGAERQ